MRAVLVLAVVLLAGCARPAPVDAYIVHGAVTIDAGEPVPADTGYHCDGSSWSPQPPVAHLFPYDGPAPALVLVRNVTGDAVGTGPGRVVQVGVGERGEMAIVSVVRESRILGRLSWDDAGVRLDGEPLRIGESRRVSAVLPLAGGSAANETLVLTAWGVGAVTTERTPRGFGCD